MRHISIKVRMTIWFTVVMVVISSLMLVFVMLMNRNQVTKPPAAQVVSVVTRNADRLEVEHGVLDLSDVDLFRHGVYTQVFDEEGQLLAGSAPTELTKQLPLAEGDVRQAQGSDGLYDVYDVSIPAAGVWVRGTISHNARGGVMEVIVPLAWSLLPALIVVSALGGLSDRLAVLPPHGEGYFHGGGHLRRRRPVPPHRPAQGPQRDIPSGRRLRRYVRPAGAVLRGGASIHLRRLS